MCLLIACAEKLPKDIIPKEKMASILVEFHLAEAVTETHIRKFEQKKMLKEDLIDEIMQKNGLDRTAFMDSYSYYIDHPAELDSIYKYVIKNLDDYLDLAENEEYRKRNEESKNDTVRQKRIDSMRQARKENQKIPAVIPPDKKKKQ